MRGRYAADPERFKSEVRIWQSQNKELTNAYSRTCYSNNKVRGINHRKAWRIKNREKINAATRVARILEPERFSAHSRKYRKTKPEIGRAHVAKRRALILARLHPARNDQAIKDFYRRASQMIKATGSRWHVDHIIPLAEGGWHHEGNLQIIPGLDNQRKNDNVFWFQPGVKTFRDVPRFLWPEEHAARFESMMTGILSSPTNTHDIHTAEIVTTPPSA